jgi:hydrogenase expression/formation protein HypC
MCLAIPGKVLEIGEHRMATIDIMGVTRKISLDLVPDAAEGDFVLVHAGFALQVVDEEFANETLELLMSLPDLGGDDLNALTEEATTTAAEARDAEIA